MKKMVLLLAGLVALTACSQSKQATKESTSNQTTKETKVSESSKDKEEKGLKFVVAPQYEGKTIFDNQKVSYFIKDSGELPSHSATLILLPLNEEQLGIVDGMSDPSKMMLKMSDVSAVE